MSVFDADPLSPFSAPVRDWFTAAFERPTPAQAKAWPHIARGEHVLLCAPTGSGKTLAAFLWAIDRLSRQPRSSAKRGVRLLYVSPLKALSYDVERNLQVPLSGMGLEVSVAIRTGDTQAKERAAIARRPPDILITTPESLFLMLTSKAREILTGVETVIVDEIHAVASTKRGSHLALTLERLDALAAEAVGVRSRDVRRGVSGNVRRGVSGDARDGVSGDANDGVPGDARDGVSGDASGAPPRGVSGIQRIGLSATQRPLEEIARFLVGPSRQCAIVDAGMRKPLDLRIEVPVESMVSPDEELRAMEGGDAAAGADPLQPLPGGEPLRNSIWPAIYPRLLSLVREHSSTIVFVNSRRTAERVALRLNELAAAEPPDTPFRTSASPEAEPPDTPFRASASPEAEPPDTPFRAPSRGAQPLPDTARAHHGSLSMEERISAEELLKSGQLPCLVATSSLELGIDMGAVDLVVQISSPKSVASGLQRIGRAGHSVGEPSRGRIFPRYRGDLLECAVLVRRMREGEIEKTKVPRNPLDVLAQQIVASVSIEGEVSVEELHRRAKLTLTYSELSLQQLENVLDMLDGRYPSSEFSELKPRIVWDRLSGLVTPRKGAQRLAVVNAGTIPDRGLYLVTLPDGRRVGELDEEMVYEARPGQAFLLGASTWRIEEIGRDRVIVTPAPGAPGAVPFWKGDGVGRQKELGEAIGAFSRWAVSESPERLASEYDLDPFAASNLIDLLREQREATGAIPSDKAIVVERFRDEIGDWRLCVLCPLGGRVNSAWALAISARVRSELGLEADAIASDDGIVIHLPDADEPPRADLAMIEPDELEDLVVGELSGSALFGARFRESAARALLIPRAMPGRRTPLWQQRLKAQSLLEVARRHGEFPVILETYRECLQDVLDLPGLRDLLSALHRRQVSLVEVETPTASPFAASLLFDFLATYMYEGDAPNAERRAAALSLDRDMLRELLGQEELRDLIDEDALIEVEADLQCLSQRLKASDVDGLHDVLRRLGDLTVQELSLRAVSELDLDGALRQLRKQRRAVSLRIGGQQRWIDASEAGLYRDALGAVPPGGLPEAFLVPVPDAVVRLVRRFAASNGPFVVERLLERYGLGFAVVDAALTELERAGALVRGELRPGGVSGQREWCDANVLRRLRRASLAALRSEVEPVDACTFASFQVSWQGVDEHPSAGAGVERLREVLVSLQGLPLAPECWEREVLPRRIGAYSPTWMDMLCSSGEVVWVGAGALGRGAGRVALYFREDAPALGPPPGVKDPPQSPLHDALLGRLGEGACFFADLLTAVNALSPSSLAEVEAALWDLVWSGVVSNDSFQPLRSGRLKPASGSGPERRHRSGSRFSSRRRLSGASHPPGRWSLTHVLFEGGPGDPVSSDPASRRRALAELLLERYGVLTREHVLSEGVKGGFAGLYEELTRLETVGAARRGYFVEGLGGAQFALPGAVERLRSLRPQADRGAEQPAIVLAATDPAQPYGASLRWPSATRREGRGPTRTPGAHVVLVGFAPVLFLERGGRTLLTLLDGTEQEGTVQAALSALVKAARAGQVGRLAIERVDGEHVLGSALEQTLTQLGFSVGPRRLTLGRSA